MNQRTEGDRSWQGVLATGEPWSTPTYVRTSDRDGPTVVITAGLHGNEPAAAQAADVVRHWPIRRGRLAILPRANVRALDANVRWTPDVDRSLGNLNRNFPRDADDTPRGPLASAIWPWVVAHEPDWLLDLHEGLDYRRRSEKSVGNSLIAHPTEPGLALARVLLEKLDATVDEDDKRFVLLETAAAGSLSRAAAERLGAHSMIVETTSKEPEALRIEQHRLVVRTLLLDLDMV